MLLGRRCSNKELAAAPGLGGSEAAALSGRDGAALSSQCCLGRRVQSVGQLAEQFGGARVQRVADLDPRRRVRTTPLVRSAFRCPQIVGWLTPKCSVKSHAQISPSTAKRRAIPSRVGCPNARRTMATAFPSSLRTNRIVILLYRQLANNRGAMPMSIATHGVSELVLEANDLAASERFYSQALGLPVVLRWAGEAWTGREPVWVQSGEADENRALEARRWNQRRPTGVHVHFASDHRGGLRAMVAQIRRTECTSTRSISVMTKAPGMVLPRWKIPTTTAWRSGPKHRHPNPSRPSPPMPAVD